MGEWSATTVWWLVAGSLVVVELLTGTFYLLMLALGASLGALAAWSGMGSSAQVTAAALAGSGGVALIHWRRRQREAQASGGNNDMNLDVGASVQVSAWQPDGTSRVQHRGAAWDALYQGRGSPQPGEHLIHGVQGNRLLLSPRAPVDPPHRA